MKRHAGSGTTATDRRLSTEESLGVNVLVTDEEESLLATTASTLESDRYRVMAGQRGSDADARLRERMDDITLLDLYMSGPRGP